MDAAKKIMNTAEEIKKGILSIPGLQMMGQPLWNIAFSSVQEDIYQIMDRMTEKGWVLNGLHKPPCVHICLTLRHTQPGVAAKFVEDLRTSVQEVKENPHSEGGMAPVYGMAANIPLRGAVGKMLKKYMDMLYKV